MAQRVLPGKVANFIDACQIYYIVSIFASIGIYFTNVNVNIYLHNVNHSGLQMLLCNDFTICHARAEALANSEWNDCTRLSIF